MPSPETTLIAEGYASLVSPATSLANTETYRAIIGDPAGDTSTTETIAIGETVTSSIDELADQDWYAIGLTAGQTIDISLIGGTLFDPYVYVYDENGNRLASDDDISWPTNPDSLLQFTASTSGVYYVGAGRYPWNSEATDGDYYPNLGTYSLTVTETTEWITHSTSNPLLRTIDWGTQVGSQVIDVFFAGDGFSADGYTSEGFNAYEMQQFGLVFDLIETYTNLTINIANTSTNAEFVVLLDLDEVSGDFLGYFNPPGETNQGVGVFDGTQWDRAAGGDLERGGYGFVTIAHEFMHGLGLAHPHDDGGTSTIMDGVTSEFDSLGTHDLNQGVFTIMTYNSGWHTGPAGTGPFNSGSFGFEGGPMAMDIALLQEKYGANGNTNGGDSTYTLPTANATGTFFETIWDTGGSDLINHNGADDAVIDLRSATLVDAIGGGGYISSVQGIAGGFTIAHGVTIENGFGGTGDDTITGNQVSNLLLGFAGHDLITGLGGNDRLNGGFGEDTLRGDAGNDTLIGGTDDDVLNGGTGDDSLEGQQDNDMLIGEGGNDLLIGGLGNDTLDGGDLNDTLRGDAGVDVLDGGGGDDRLVGGDDGDTAYGRLGNDLIFGGQGYDWLYGLLGDDTIFGGLGNDRLFGGVGDDSLIGYDQNDSLIGDWGRDYIDAGDGDDWVNAGGDSDVIYGRTGNDTIFGGSGWDTLLGQTGNDELYAGTGNDRAYGGDGNDALWGGNQNDTLDAGDGHDTLTGGLDDDRLIGSTGSDLFVFYDGDGNDTIVDFESLNVAEKIHLGNVTAIANLAALNLADANAGAATQVGMDVVINTGGGNSITLLNVNIFDLDATDFAF